jgi:copper(I)-binding protein
MGLVKPLEIGQTIEVTLKFSKSGDKVIDVPVLEDAPLSHLRQKPLGCAEAVL